MDRFPETRWSLVLAAGQAGSPDCESALQKIFSQYWKPVYGFFRGRGLSHSDAEDATQDFLVHVLEHSTLGRADRRLGRFRAYLLGALKRFLSDRNDRKNARKRGGDRQLLALDRFGNDAGWAGEDFSNVSPEIAFDRTWALTLLERAMSRLKEEYMGRGQAELASILAGFLSADGDADTYEDAAEHLALSLSAVKSAILRLRRRYGELVRDELAQTVSSPHEIDLI
jgi:RNA polymerase sigma-70 factor (ECF subfamily)